MIYLVRRCLVPQPGPRLMEAKCKILLVDDQKDIVIALKKGLEQNNFEVDAFTRSKEALSNFRPGVHDFVVLDIRMPGLSGIRLFTAIRELDDNVKAVFMTAFEGQEKEWLLVNHDLNAHRFLKKPVKLHHLINAISQINADKVPR